MLVSEKNAARVSSELSADGNVLTIRISGNFDFHLHRAFLRAYQNLNPSPKHFCIDLSETQHLDSAALGMLLLLRDHCLSGNGENAGATIELRNANSHVENILVVSKFDKIFAIR